MPEQILLNNIKGGDVLFVRNVKVNGLFINPRPFLVLGMNSNSPVTQLTMFEISGQNKLGNSFPYNVPIIKSTSNGLNQDSHVKSDKLFIYCEIILPNNITKFGELELDTYMDEIITRAKQAKNDHMYYYFDQSNDGKAIKGW